MTFTLFSKTSSGLWTFVLKDAVGGVWLCSVPQVEATLVDEVDAESYVREKTVPPRIPQQTDVQRKINVIAIIRFVMPCSLRMSIG